MIELTIEEIKKIQLEILRDFDGFCRANDIKYFLSNGTLLGAVKYKGYIPWDDDIDVFMLREEYDKLVNTFKEKNKNKNLTLNAVENNSSYLFPFAKLSDNSTLLVENGYLGVDIGINIDIFPVDNYGKTPEDCADTFKRFEKYRKRLNKAKLKITASKTVWHTAAKFVFTFLYKLVGAKYYCRKIIKEATTLGTADNYRGNVVWGFYGASEAFPKELFEEMAEVEFEGEKYNAPKDYDRYLTGLYGEWRKDPPTEKQKTHHTYKAYKK